MASELQDLMGDLEVTLVETVARLEHAEMDLLYVGVLDLEQRVEDLHNALAAVADSIAEESLRSPCQRREWFKPVATNILGNKEGTPTDNQGERTNVRSHCRGGTSDG